MKSALWSFSGDVIVYVDDDDPRLADYQKQGWNERAKLIVGPPIKRGPACNVICDTYRNYRAYLIASDDIVFDRDDWEPQFWEAFDAFGDDLGCAHLQSEDREDYVNWAAVSRKWIDALGWYNYPGCLYFCQDTVIQALATALDRLTLITPPVLTHRVHAFPETHVRLQADTQAFLWYMAKQFGPDLAKLRAAAWR